jgi:hypothetical protein
MSYEFDYIPIEVRADDDPYTVVSKSGGVGNDGLDLSFFNWLGFVFFSFSFIAAVVFVACFIYLKSVPK